MSLSLRAVLPAGSPMAALAALPMCANPLCPRPSTLWQRWWGRHEGVWLQQHWYCSLSCFHRGFYRRLQQASLSQVRPEKRPNRLPLGLIMVSNGDIEVEQLRRALRMQAAAGSGKLGEWLIRTEAVTEHQVAAALSVQQGCPGFWAHEPQLVPGKMHWPEALVHRFRAVPVFHSLKQSCLYVGFLDQVDRGFLYSLEQMLGCRAQPCIVLAKTYQQYHELRAFAEAGETIEIPQRQNAIEMTNTVGNYAQQLHAERCSIVRCVDQLWTRLEPPHGRHVDLLLRLSPQEAS